MNQDNIVRTPATHGFGITHEEDGVKRRFEAVRFPDLATGFAITTWWKPDEEPMVTKFVLSPNGLDLFFELLSRLDKMDDFPIPANSGDDTKDKL